MDFTYGDWPEMVKVGVVSLVMLIVLARILLRG